MVILRANARSLLFLWLINLNDNNHRAKGVVNAVQGTGSCQGLGSWFKHRGVSSSTGESVRAPGSQFEHRGVSSSTGESVRAPGSQFEHRGVNSSTRCIWFLAGLPRVIPIARLRGPSPSKQRFLGRHRQILAEGSMPVLSVCKLVFRSCRLA